MSIHDDLARRPPQRDSVLTIGMFDGVHSGHRHLLSLLVHEAARTGRTSVVVTFRNHPASVLRPDSAPRLLTSVRERQRLIEEAGIDLVVPVRFDLELSRLTARDFAAALSEHMHMRGLVVGPGFAMGHRREGDVPMLTSLGREMGFSVTPVQPFLDEDGRPVRSTAIRAALSRGDLARASRLLGRNYTFTGRVVRGHGRGGPLGFPTANLDEVEGLALPGDGIYAAWAHVDAARYMAATSIGVRPTFEDGDHSVEAYIMDFEGDLYGREVRLEFVRWLRGELKFDSVKGLQEQVSKDVDQTRALLEGSR